MTTASKRQYPLWMLLQQLKSEKFVDLTHPFGPGIPHAPDFPDENRTILYNFDSDGFMAHKYEHVGQWGTHVDPPIHFVEGGRYLDDIQVEEMILPLVIFNASFKAAENPDYELSIDDIKGWEEEYGRIPEGAFAALRTDWSKRWPDAHAMANKDARGTSRTPGWGLAALQFLCEERNIGACGHETTDTDPGVITSRDEFPGETYILKQDKFQIELLANLDQVAEAGAIVVACFPKPEKGSGFPARVFAITPERT